MHLALYGHFGAGNIGNDSTLEAMVSNTRRLLPSATLSCICTGPRRIGERFGIEALPIDSGEARDGGSEERSSRVARLTSRALDEVRFWLYRTRWLREVDQLIVVGTGALDDMAVNWWNAPYDLFKWCHAAWLVGTPVAFVSVGAGPIVHPISRALMRRALRIARFRSFRDAESLNYARSIGLPSVGDRVCPDLVFSLTDVEYEAVPSTAPARTVGIGLISYYGWQHDPVAGDAVYRAYLQKIVHVTRSLLQRGYGVRLLAGDSTDDWTVQAVLQSCSGSDAPALPLVTPIVDRQALFEQIAATDVVIASRFHNVLSALMVGRPVISLGYHSKNDALMREMGLGAFCHHIESFDADRVLSQFEQLAAAPHLVVSQLSARCREYRRQLEEQYRTVLIGEQDRT